MNSKRGLSSVVISMLIILVSIAAMLILAAFIRNMMGNQKEKVSEAQIPLSTSLEIKDYQLDFTDIMYPTAKVTIFNSGNEEPSSLKLVFSTNDNSYIYSAQGDMPAELETKTYTINFLEGYLGSSSPPQISPSSIPEDFNGDGNVDMEDVLIFSPHFGHVSGDQEYNPRMDVCCLVNESGDYILDESGNGEPGPDGSIDVSDLLQLVYVYNMTSNPIKEIEAVPYVRTSSGKEIQGQTASKTVT